MNYNKLINNDDIYSDSDVDNNNDNDIQPLCDISSRHTNILNNILQHQYIDKLSLDLKEITSCKCNKTRVIVYRINKYEKNDVVEFYLSDEFITIDLSKQSDILMTIQTYLNHLCGVSRLKGSKFYDNNQYIFVQMRDSYDNNNWVTLWDIIVNKHYFGKQINQEIVQFFIQNSEIGNLFKGVSTIPCIKPIILYTEIDKQYHGHVRQYRTIQYCQKEHGPLIKLRKFKENDNIRTICFIDDTEFSNNYDDLVHNGHVIVKMEEEPIWIFKNEINIFSYVK